MTEPFSSASAVMAPADDLMEFSIDTSRDQPQDDIDIDIDIEGGLNDDKEDENMAEGEDGAAYKDDDEMIDDASAIEDAIIEDAIDYEENLDDTLIANDEELVDAEELGIGDGTTASANDSFVQYATLGKPDLQGDPSVPYDTFAAEGEHTSVADNLANTGENDVLEAPLGEDDGHLIGDEAPRVQHEENGAQNSHADIAARHSDTGVEETAQESTGPDFQQNESSNGALVADDITSQNVETAYDEAAADETNQEDGNAAVSAIDQVSEVPEHDGLPEQSAAELPLHSPDDLENEGDDDADASESLSDHEPVYQATVRYQDNEMLLFQPGDGDKESQTFLLNDDALAHESIKVLLGSCRSVLGESVEASEELTLELPALGLSYSEDNLCSSQVQLSSLIDIYSNLQRNDGNQEHECLMLVLGTQVTKASSLQSLFDAAHHGQGLTDVQTSLFRDAEHLDEEDDVADTPLDTIATQEGDPPRDHDLQANEAEQSLEGEAYGDHKGDAPGTPKNDPTHLEIGDTDNFDFTSPLKAPKDDGLLAAEEHEASSPLGTTDDITADAATVTDGAVQGPAVDFVDVIETPKISLPDKAIVETIEELHGDREDADEQGPDTLLNTNNASSGLTEANAHDEVEPTGATEEVSAVVMEAGDDLEEFDELDDPLEPAQQQTTQASPAVTNDATSTNTLQDDHLEQDHGNDEINDEITFGDEDDDEFSLEAEEVSTANHVEPVRESSPGTGSLKRQRPVDLGDEDDTLASHYSQPDVKRARSDSES